MAESLYQKRMKVRRMSDIERLAQQYSKDVRAMGSQYQTSFADYQKQVSAQMAPYESALEKYKVDMSAYQSQAAAYQQRLAAHQKMLEDIAKNPRENIELPYRTTKLAGEHSVPVVLIDGKWTPFLPGGDTGQYEFVEAKGGKAIISKPRAAPTFSESAPTAPTAPTKPEISQFDQSQFEAKSKDLGQTYQREFGERKSARLAAVSRSSRRPLLQGS